jgi:hypothetical protein
MRTLSLEQWDVEVGQYLQNIRVGAALCERGVKNMVFRPTFETLAEGDLEALGDLLEAALDTVHRAQARLRDKPHVG